jgi:hypothetical protein
VELHVRDAALWFEGDAALEPAPEAFAGMLLLPALRAHATLRSEAAIDAAWLASAAHVPKLFASWWGDEERFPIEAEPAPASRDPLPSTALCFTGGVDSFFSLLHGGHRPAWLLFVVGFDVRLDDEARAATAALALREVAHACGAHPLLLWSNARRHPLFRSVSWEHSHGSALAAAAHLLARRAGRLVIPSTNSSGGLVPWGSHPDLDPLWSSSRVRIEHDSVDTPRARKVAAIAGHALVQHHLRVCWENRGPTANCSRCEKCVRTLVMLAVTPHYARFTGFDVETPLAPRIDALPPLAPHLVRPWELVAQIELDRALRRAVERLLARSRPRAA